MKSHSLSSYDVLLMFEFTSHFIQYSSVCSVTIKALLKFNGSVLRSFLFRLRFILDLYIYICLLRNVTKYSRTTIIFIMVQVRLFVLYHLNSTKIFAEKVLSRFFATIIARQRETDGSFETLVQVMQRDV